MNPPGPDFPDNPDGTERQLRARLRSTTPEFEARFDELRRQLAHEPRRQPQRIWFYSWFTVRPAWAGAALAACIVALFAYRSTPPKPLPKAEAAAYGELLALNDTLRTALPLTDPETLDAMLELPLSPRG